jgi:hypothetical protein
LTSTPPGKESLPKISKRARFISVAPGWSLEEFADWLERGAEAFADDPQGRSWAVAFPTLPLSEERFPADQLIAQFKVLAKVSHAAYGRVRRAILQLLNSIGGGHSPEYVRFLLVLAASTKPVDYLDVVRRHLDRPSIQSAARDWQLIADILVDRAVEQYPKPYCLQLISSFRDTPWWTDEYYAKTIVLRIEISPDEWTEIRRKEEAELRALAETDPEGYAAINDAVENNPPVGPGKSRSREAAAVQAAIRMKDVVREVVDNVTHLKAQPRVQV